jgi:tetratricopeptide (TPR) repeat protein
MTPSFSIRTLAVFCIILGSVIDAQARNDEITYPSKAFAKLDTFESLNLEDADKLFNKKDYKGAYAAYKAYSFEFGKSPALPYVLLRMGRCLHMLGKRNAAIKGYQDVVDYFPDDITFAAGALYYIGECHGQNGDDAKKLAVWAKMVKDDEYVAESRSGTALTYLGNAMDKLGKFEEAIEYHKRTAINFRKSNDRAADSARKAVTHHYVVRSPNHDKLKEFYIAAGGFDGRGHKINDPEDDDRYWNTVLDNALRGGKDAEQKKKSCQYWAAKMGTRFGDNDELRRKHCDLQYVYDNDKKLWFERMNTQFASKEKTIKRVLQWCDYYNREREAKSAFYAEHGRGFVAGMDTKQKVDVMNRLWHPLAMHDEIRVVLRGIKLQDMSDKEIQQIASFATRLEPEETVLRYYAKMSDKLFAGKCRFDYFASKSHRNKEMTEKALAEIPALKKSPKYAGPELSWREAELLQGIGEYEAAIKAYRAANKQPDSTWRVTDCLVAMKNYGGAIKNVQGLESVKATAAAASLRIADIYKAAGQKGKEVDQLRIVLRRYPKSSQSSTAHERLESYGVALIGGENKAEE